MMYIAICEDQGVLRKKYIEYLREHLRGSDMSYEIHEYEKGSDLFEGAHHIYDFILLDVELGEELDGIEVAKRLRKEQNNTDIVFLTGHKSEAYRAFEVEAFRYLIKPIQKETFSTTINELLKRRTLKLVNALYFKGVPTMVRLYPDEIMYIETIGRKQHIHTLTEEYEVTHTMKELEEMLKDYSFFRIHKSFLVNIKYIKCHTNDTVTIENNEKLSLSRLRVRQFKEAILVYIREAEWNN